MLQEKLTFAKKLEFTSLDWLKICLDSFAQIVTNVATYSMQVRVPVRLLEVPDLELHYRRMRGLISMKPVKDGTSRDKIFSLKYEK